MVLMRCNTWAGKEIPIHEHRIGPIPSYAPNLGVKSIGEGYDILKL